MSVRMEIPLFPLHTVLFPAGPLALRIFEPRYLDMISRCLKQESGFGVVLIESGHETGEVPGIYEVGTYATIAYWNKRADGLLGVTARGEHRFRVLETEVRADKLMQGVVEPIPNEEPTEIPESLASLVSLAETIINELEHPYITMPKKFDDAFWVGGRLTELLPLERPFKQKLLQMDDPIDRLKAISAAMSAMQPGR